MNYETMQESAIRILDGFAFDATLFTADGQTKGKTRVVSMSNDKAAMMGMTISAQHRAFYISPESKVAPIPGDYIEFGSGSNKRKLTFRQTSDLTPDGLTTMYYAGVAS